MNTLDPLVAASASSRQSSITAIALISIRYSGEVILVISTMVEAGAGGLKYSRRTLWIVSKCSMLRHVDVDAADVVHRAAGGLDRGLEVFAHLAGLRLDVADAGDRAVGRREVMPEMNTSRPRASIMVACEKWPLGLLILSDRICFLGMTFLC